MRLEKKWQVPLQLLSNNCLASKLQCKWTVVLNKLLLNLNLGRRKTNPTGATYIASSGSTTRPLLSPGEKDKG